LTHKPEIKGHISIWVGLCSVFSQHIGILVILVCSWNLTSFWITFGFD